MRQVDFSLYLITDRRLCGNEGLAGRIARALEGGVRAVQLREKDLDTRELFELGKEIRAMTSGFGARLFVNDDAALALAIGADGVHLSQNGLPADICRKIIEPHMLIGVSTHSPDEAIEAEENGADFITFGPVYHTASKAQYGPPVGMDSLRAACAAVDIPVFALGGIDASNISEALSAGADGVAMISAILAAPEPGLAASEILEMVCETRSVEGFSGKKG